MSKHDGTPQEEADPLELNHETLRDLDVVPDGNAKDVKGGNAGTSNIVRGSSVPDPAPPTSRMASQICAAG